MNNKEMGCQCIMLIQDNTNTTTTDTINPTSTTYAGFFVRLAAYLVDFIIVGFALLLVKVPMWFLSYASSSDFFTRYVLFEFSIWDIFFYLLTVLYFVLMTYFKGATLGKLLFRIRVVYDVPDEKLTIINVLYRETIGRYLSSLLFVGYILVGATNDKRGLHDMLCDTHVVYV